MFKIKKTFSILLFSSAGGNGVPSGCDPRAAAVPAHTLDRQERQDVHIKCAAVCGSQRLPPPVCLQQRQHTDWLHRSTHVLPPYQRWLHGHVINVESHVISGAKQLGS